MEIGAQSVYFEQKGAFTGAVSTCMVASVGAKHGLSGHSERRVIFENSDGDINKKTRKLIAQGINPMLCIGESKDEYEGGLNTAVCASQLSKDLQGVTKEEMKMVTIAYEPVWAMAPVSPVTRNRHRRHEFIRGWLAKMYDEEVAASTRILYGGRLHRKRSMSSWPSPILMLPRRGSLPCFCVPILSPLHIFPVCCGLSCPWRGRCRECCMLTGTKPGTD